MNYIKFFGILIVMGTFPLLAFRTAAFFGLFVFFSMIFLSVVVTFASNARFLKILQNAFQRYEDGQGRLLLKEGRRSIEYLRKEGFGSIEALLKTLKHRGLKDGLTALSGGDSIADLTLRFKNLTEGILIRCNESIRSIEVIETNISNMGIVGTLGMISIYLMTLFTTSNENETLSGAVLVYAFLWLTMSELIRIMIVSRQKIRIEFSRDEAETESRLLMRFLTLAECGQGEKAFDSESSVWTAKLE